MSSRPPRLRGEGASSTRLPDDPLWYRDAVVYELRVGTFQDSDGDGIGDFRGLTSRLDYLEDLGVTALWLLPFYPSPRRDDGYDIASYTDVHADSGRLEDFRTFLREAHKRGLRVITELVINHTSDQHPWFQRARRSPPGSRWRDFYVWSDSAREYPDARIIFKDFEHSNWSWDPVAKAYYWHRFYSHQPDLNFASPLVRKEVLRALDFWLKMGVDGMRLDAIPYLFEREGTNCENLPETHAFLKDLRSHVDARYRDRMLLAEANQWPEDAVAYFGQGDECHMCFHFPVMPRLFMSLYMEDRYPIIDILAQTPAIPEVCQWALFLRNHDELTLEMVTDEERDYMYRVYAHDTRARINLGIRRRLAPLLGNDRRRIELLNALLFALPGTPVLYYGDEIGMGDNIYLGDRNGVRTPMQWSPDRNAGFSRANPQQLCLPVVIDPEYNYETVNVEAQQRNPHSLLHWMKRLIALRKRYRAFGRGSLEVLHPSNAKVLAFLRCYDDEVILVVANLSRFVEYVELDLSAWRGRMVVELFGGRPLPPVGELPYLLTLGPHSFYWLRLEEAHAWDQRRSQGPAGGVPRLRQAGGAAALLRDAGREALEDALPQMLRSRRWFGGKSQAVDSARIVDAIRAAAGQDEAQLLLVEAHQPGGATTWALPVAAASGAAAEAVRREHPEAVLLEVEAEKPALAGVLWDATADPAFCQGLLELMQRRRRLRGEHGDVVATRTRAFAGCRGPEDAPLTVAPLRAEQSNTSVRFGDRLILKLFRRVAEGENPELEIGRFLTERARFPHAPPLAGALEFRATGRPPATLAVLHGLVENEGDAWSHTLDAVERCLGDVLTRRADRGDVAPPFVDALEAAAGPPSELAEELIGSYLESARLLGQRTAELHVALASAADHADFAPEPFGSLYQRSLYQSMRTAALRRLEALRAARAGLSDAVRAEVDALLALEPRLLDAYGSLVGEKLEGVRIRCHGDYHLGQVLRTGNDFTILDFEGEPARPPTERRLKRSPLTDVAGMLRSFDYAVNHVLLTSVERGPLRPEDVPGLAPWARFWRQWAGASFLGGYLGPARDAGLVPSDDAALRRLLDAFCLDKAVYEIGYELDHRPHWLQIPIRGIRELLEEHD